MNRLAEKLEYQKGTVAVAQVNGKNEQSRKMLKNAGEVVGPDWSKFNDQRCLRLTLPRPKGPADLQSHRFHMTMAYTLLSHTDALVGYKYRNRVNNDHPEEDVWVAHHWDADMRTHTQHRVLPKRLAEPINRLIDTISDLCRKHTATSQET
ncbi:MAG: hypothetical protein HQL56_03265 [Magnetococcales bacterium]|nr:hypothetical protein [Magnetococcales bacterium]